LAESHVLGVPGIRLERLNARDLRVLLFWVLAGIIGAATASRYFFKAFPEASVHFTVQRGQAIDLARNFLANQHADLRSYQSSIVFSVDESTKTYLERTVGLEQANHLISTQISGWYWEIRFFRPQQKEEYRVRISPDGHIVGYEHVIEEARAGAHLDRAQAQTVAEQFLRTDYRADLSVYDLLPEELNSAERPARRDWSFTWQRRDFHVPAGSAGAPYQLRVTVQGDAPGAAEEFLKVPEAWTRSFDRMRSANDLIETIALIPYCLLYGSAFWLIFEFSRRGLLRWGPPIQLGLFLAALFFLMAVNNWPGTRAEYNTNSSYSSFVFSQFAAAAVLSLAQGLLVTLALAPGEPLYRASQPDKLRFGALFSIPGFRSKEFFRACVIGVSLAAVHIGYVVMFYLVGQRFGVWAPQDVNYTNSVSTLLPWLEAFTIGIYAACSEEFMFRMFAIPFVHRLTKSKYLAVILPAFAWGFLHANYPQEPPYIRGIEIGLIGIVAGLVMLRWGILATLVWHYTVDAMLGSLLLLRSASAYLRISGAIVGGLALIPLAIAGVLYFVRGGFEVREDLLNREASANPPAAVVSLEEKAAAIAEASAEASASTVVYDPLPRTMIWKVLACGAAGIVLLFAIRPKVIGSFIQVHIDASQALNRAEQVLSSRQVNVSRYRHAAIFLPNEDPLANEFLHEKIGIEATNKIYEQLVPVDFWRVRFFRDGEQEEYLVILRSDGQLHSVHHTLDDRASGPNLSKEEALARAEAWLRDNKAFDFPQWTLIDSASVKRPNRTDHAFSWQRNAPLAGGPGPATAAFLRTEVSVLGAEPSNYRVYVKLPEQWVRDQQHETLAGTLQVIWRYAFFTIAAVAFVVVFFKNIKHPAADAVPWNRLARFTAFGAVAYAIILITNLPTVLFSYPTDKPFQIFAATIGIAWVITTALVLGSLIFLFGLGAFFWTYAGFDHRLPRWFGMPPAYYRDALLIATAGPLAYLGLQRLDYLAAALWHGRAASLTAAAPSGLDALSPAAQAIARSVFSGLYSAAVVAVIAGFIAAFIKPTWLRVILVVAAALAMVGGGSPAELIRQFLFAVAQIVIVWWAVSRVVRFNVLGYYLFYAVFILLGAGFEFVSQPNSYLRTNGVVVLGTLGILLLWPLVAWRRRSVGGIAPGLSL
jgi:membrane protease YdiL (CAAX protease family)